MSQLLLRGNCTDSLGELTRLCNPGTYDFSFHNSKALRGLDWSQSGLWVAGLQGVGPEGKPSVQLFVVKDCLRP